MSCMCKCQSPVAPVRAVDGRLTPGASARQMQLSDSVVSCVQRLEQMGANVVALGQTVFWDEPMKAIACAALQRYAPSRTFTAAVHDTDYFSKLPGRRRARGSSGGLGGDGFALLPHDEGSTKELWAAIGEASSLFGSEAPIRKSDLIAAGVPLRWLSREYDGGVDEFYRRFTSAYGWRGVVSRASDDRVACDIQTAEVADALCELLAWAFGQTAEVVLGHQASAAVQRLEAALIDAVRGQRRQAAHASLTHAYMNLLPDFFAMLLGERPEQLRLASSMELFRFNTHTCHLPRFDLLDCFLSPHRRHACRECYDEAVRGSGIYSLEQFGEDAIPFDVVVPGLGRGTIHAGKRAVAFDFPDGRREHACAEEPADRGVLAAVVEAEFGGDACLVGKAVVLPLMLSREQCMVLHQDASVYVPRTRRLARMLQDRGMQRRLYPILRMHYATWDSLRAIDTEFALPPHLAHLFGRKVISSAEFAARWRGVMSDARRIIRELTRTRKPRDLLRRLPEGPALEQLAAQYQSAVDRRRQSAAPIQELLNLNESKLMQVRRLQTHSAALHRRRGAIRRERIVRTRRRLWELQAGGAEDVELSAVQERLHDAEAEREAVNAELTGTERELQTARHEQARLRGGLLGRVRSREHRAALAEYREAVLQLEYARLRAVSDAYRALALERADHRPSWWWFPAVDPQGAWFARVIETATMRFEEFAE